MFNRKIFLLFCVSLKTRLINLIKIIFSSNLFSLKKIELISSSEAVTSSGKRHVWATFKDAQPFENQYVHYLV